MRAMSLSLKQAGMEILNDQPFVIEVYEGNIILDEPLLFIMETATVGDKVRLRINEIFRVDYSEEFVIPSGTTVNKIRLRGLDDGSIIEKDLGNNGIFFVNNGLLTITIFYVEV